SSCFFSGQLVLGGGFLGSGFQALGYYGLSFGNSLVVSSGQLVSSFDGSSFFLRIRNGLFGISSSCLGGGQFSFSGSNLFSSGRSFLLACCSHFASSSFYLSGCFGGVFVQRHNLFLEISSLSDTRFCQLGFQLS